MDGKHHFASNLSWFVAEFRSLTHILICCTTAKSVLGTEEESSAKTDKVGL